MTQPPQSALRTSAGSLRTLRFPPGLSFVLARLGSAALLLGTTSCGLFAVGRIPAGEPPVRQVHAHTAVYRDLKGPLFPPGGPSPYDVEQGEVGTCWLLAAMASLARQQPEAVRRIFETAPDGGYLVYFHDPSATERQPVRVSLRAPHCLLGGPIYASARGAVWVSLLEKAYAQRFSPRTGYDGIGGDHPAMALRHLTGWTVEDFDIDGDLSGPSAEEEWLRLSLEDSAFAPMVAGSRILQRDPRILAMHAYSITGVFATDGGRKMVRLFDPEGVAKGPHHELLLPLGDFVEAFYYVSIAHPSDR